MPLSLRAYARHRKKLKLPGGTLSGVQKAVAQGRIQLDPDGLIDADSADRLWRERTAPTGDHHPTTNDHPDEVVSFPEARRRKELALAQQREMEVAQLRGRLIPLDVYEQRLTVICERLAARVKGMGRYLGDVQRAMSDVEAAALLERISDDLLRALMSTADELEDDLTPDAA
jgi:hypothetical protein